MGDRMKPIIRRGSSGAKHKVITHKVPKSRTVVHELEVHREHPKEEKTSKGKSDPASPKESVKEKRTKGQKLERWLLTRKTWRYMADAGRKLIPDGAHNRLEDIPKIEAYFQEVCHREPRFLLWRKQSYPGALGFRSRGRSRGGRLKKGGSCRDKTTSSADEAEDVAARTNLGLLEMTATSGGRFDVQKLKRDFLQGTTKLPTAPTPAPPSESSESLSNVEEDALLLSTVQMYLNEKDSTNAAEISPAQRSINHTELLEKLREHLNTIDKIASKDRRTHRASVHFEGDKTQLMLLETLRRHFSKSTSKERVISDLLTDRKLLERLYFDLRKARGFTAGRRGTGLVVPGGYSNLTSWQPSWRLDFDAAGNGVSEFLEKVDEVKSTTKEEEKPEAKPEPKAKEAGTQTEPISSSLQAYIEDELRKLKAMKQEAEEPRELISPRSPTGTVTRRSSVDNDDISPSVSDTIRRYLRMARKKSIDSDKADRFKRVNYDKNIRNIKSKGDIPPVSDLDEFNKNEQTEESWVSVLKDFKLSEEFPSSRSSFDVTTATSTTELDDTLSPPLSPASLVKSPSGILSSGQSFLSNLLHGLHPSHPNVTNSPCVSTAPPGGGSGGGSSGSPGMQKASKSTSNMVQQGSRLVSKKIWKSRSKSQPRIAVTVTPFWSPHPQMKNTWVNSAGVQVTLADTTILQLTEIERRVLQKVALAKLQALNLGVSVKIPSEIVAAPRKRRPYLMKRKALTTGIFEPSRNKDEWGKDEKVSGSGLVFGIPLSQCVENERKAKMTSSTPGISPSTPTSDTDFRRKSLHGSHPSFQALSDVPSSARFERKGSTESLMSQTSNIPLALDSMNVMSSSELASVLGDQPFDPGVPNIVLTCLNVIEQQGLNTEGVFRVGSSKNRVRQMREEFDCGRGNELLANQEIYVHDAATLLKEYLRELPDPLLCKDLYPAFINSQRLQSQRLQIESIQHLLQLLPAVHRDTLWHLLRVLVSVANNSKDHKDTKGLMVKGNKMDVSNLSTLFAPNILYSDKDQISGKYALSPAGAEERADAINVVRFLIERHKELFALSADLLNEVYLHMMDSNPEELDQLLRARIPVSEVLCDPESEATDEVALASEAFYELDGNSVDSVPSMTSFGEDQPRSPPGTGTLSSGAETLDRDTSSKSPLSPSSSPSSSTLAGSTSEKKLWSREEFLHENAGTGGPREVDARRRHERVAERAKRRSRDETRRPDGLSLRKSSSSHPDDVRLADFGRRPSAHFQQSNGSEDLGDAITGSLKISAPRGPSTTLALNLDDSDIPYIEDSGHISAESLRQSTHDSCRLPVQLLSMRGKLPTDSDSSSTSPPYYLSTPQQLSPGYEAHGVSSPPGNTTSSVCSLSSGSELGLTSPPSWASSPPNSPDSAISSVNYIPEPIVSRIVIPPEKPARSFVYKISSGKEDKNKVAKSASSSAVSSSSWSVGKKAAPKSQERAPASISSIGGAVLRSKTADIERMLGSGSGSGAAAGPKSSGSGRSYVDTRHATKHLIKEDTSRATAGSVSGPVPQARSKSTIWKRKELISSEPKKEKHFF
nr:PREDICTED: uncharacterized protein LOC109042921 [Bemisia tabaci]